MPYQTIYNPATKQILSIDLGASDAYQRIVSYYQQGWTAPPAGTPIPPPSAGITGGTTSGGTVTLPGYYAPAGGGEHVAYLPGQTLPTGAVIVIPPKTIQVKGPSLPPNIEGITPEGNIVLPSGQVVAPSMPNAPSILDPFKSGDSYNLMDIVQRGTPGQILMAKQTWPDQDWNYLSYANRPIWDISTKAGSAAWDKLSKEKQQLFRPVMDVTIDQYAQMTDRQKLNVKSIVAKEVSTEVYSRLGEGTKSYATPKLTTAQIASAIALSMVPVYGTIRTWGSQGTAGKALGIASDVLWIIPFVGGISSGVRLTTAGRSIGKAAQARAIAKATKNMVIAEVKAPVTVILHPIRTGKAALEPIETMLRPSKLPLAGMEMRYNTQRIPIVGTAADAVADTAVVRTKIVNSMIARTGKTATGKYITATAEMPEALRRIGPAAMSGTPDVRPFLNGAVIDKDLYVAPTLSTRFVWATSKGERPVIGALTKNPFQGALLIRDEKILAQITEGQESYIHMAELEARLKIGSIDLPKPSQILMSRDLDGNPFRILVIGKKFSKVEIAQFKVVGSADTLRTIFKPSIQYSRTTNASIAKLGKLEDELADLQRAERAASNAREVGIIRSRIIRLNTRVESARANVSRAVSGRVQYVAINTRRESVLQKSRTTPPTRNTRVPVDVRAVNIEASRIAPVSPGRTPPPISIERVPPGEYEERPVPPKPSERVVPIVPERTPPPVIPEIGTPKSPAVPLILSSISKSAKRKLLQSGTVAWKQGLFYKVAVIQNRKLIVLTTKEKPEGVPIVKGIKSAFKTLTRKGAYFPPEAKYDMGIMDVKITKKGKQIRFVRDVKRKTHGNYIVGEPELIVKS